MVVVERATVPQLLFIKYEEYEHESKELDDIVELVIKKEESYGR